jgi:putative component of membrane protein insertase Oxa1/YidC/SpoIIIJ protein YidD
MTKSKMRISCNILHKARPIFRRHWPLLICAIAFIIASRPLAVGAIDIYQKHISSHDGRSCPCRLLYRESCSQRAKNLIINKGIISAALDIPAQHRRCKAAAETLKRLPKPRAGECSDCVDQAFCYSILCAAVFDE